MTNKENYDAIIVGGGQAGITLSYYLQKRHVRHLLLEKELPFSSWRKRWDGFRANTPNWMNTLPILEPSKFPGGDIHGFASRDEIVAYLEECLKVVNPPMKTGACVQKIVQLPKNRWEIRTDDFIYETSNVAVCTGAMHIPKIPLGASGLPPCVPQLHSSNYLNPKQIESNSVLVVGSGSSGMQICKKLCESGKFARVYLAASNVLVLPDTILAIPVHRLLHFFGLFDVKKDSWIGKLMYSGLEERGDPILRPDPHDLAKSYGVHLFGKFAHVQEHMICFSDGQSLSTNDLTIIWCTGFKKNNFDLIESTKREALFGKDGTPIHVRGVLPQASGLYFVGLRYQYTVASHDLYGVGKDAMYIAEQIQKHLKRGSI